GLACGRPGRLVRLLDARPMRHLGESSYSLYLIHGPIVVVIYDRIVAGRVGQAAWSFAVTLALAVPLTVVFARALASVFEPPFRQHRGWSWSARRRPPRDQPRSRRERCRRRAAGRRAGTLRRAARAGSPDRRRPPRIAVARALRHAAGGAGGRRGGGRRRACGSQATAARAESVARS